MGLRDEFMDAFRPGDPRNRLRREMMWDNPNGDWMEAAQAREARRTVPRTPAARFNENMKKWRFRLWPLRRDLRWLEGEAARCGLTLEEAIALILHR